MNAVRKFHICIQIMRLGAPFSIQDILVKEHFSPPICFSDTILLTYQGLLSPLNNLGSKAVHVVTVLPEFTSAPRQVEDEIRIQPWAPGSEGEMK